MAGRFARDVALRSRQGPSDAEIIDAKVLSNRKPPYSLAGGLYDALKATGGDIMVATNAQARKARALFEETEGIDIYSAAGIATASLVKSVADGRIDPEKIVMLNITAAANTAASRIRNSGISNRASSSRSRPIRRRS